MEDASSLGDATGPTSPPPSAADEGAPIGSVPTAERPTTPPTTGRGDEIWARFEHGRALFVIVVLLLLIRLVAIASAIVQGEADGGTLLGGDPQRYLEILTSPGTPYRDFAVEFPPLTLALTALLPRATLSGMVVGLTVSQLALEAGTAIVLAWAWGRRAALAFLIIGTPIALVFPFPYFRIDLLSVFLAVAGLALLRKRHELTGAAILAAAVFAKVWPLGLGPILVVRRQWRGFGMWIATGLVGLITWLTWAGAEGVRQVATYRNATGWQIESIPGSWFHMLDPDSSAMEQGAIRTATEATTGARLALTVGTVIVVGLAWWLASRARPESAALATESYAPLLATIALIVLSPIISPQYVLWLVPFAAIASAEGDYWIGGLTLITGTLSSIQLLLNEALIEGSPWAISSLALRNALLIIVGGLAAARLIRLAPQKRATPGSPRPTPVSGEP